MFKTIVTNSKSRRNIKYLFQNSGISTPSIVWGGALRDDTKNDCVADYTIN